MISLWDSLEEDGVINWEFQMYFMPIKKCYER